MYQIWYEELVSDGKVHLYHSLMTCKETWMVKSNCLYAHISGIANSADSFSGVVTNLNNNESSKMYFSANISTLQIAFFVLGNLFWARYRYKSLKYGLLRYPVCISFTDTDKCVPFRAFLYINFSILSISACFSKNFCTSLSVLIRLSNSGGSWKYVLLGIW